jgi:hypothetical protein
VIHAEEAKRAFRPRRVQTIDYGDTFCDVQLSGGILALGNGGGEGKIGKFSLANQRLQLFDLRGASLHDMTNLAGEPMPLPWFYVDGKQDLVLFFDDM